MLAQIESEGAEKVDPVVVRAAGGEKSESQAGEGGLGEVFVVCAYVNCGFGLEADFLGVSQEGWEIVMWTLACSITEVFQDAGLLVAIRARLDRRFWLWLRGIFSFSLS